MDRLGLAPKSYILATVHRAENTDDPRRLSTIVEALQTAQHAAPVVLPLHPRTQGCLKQMGLLAKAKACTLVDPVGFLDMLILEKNARLVVTDSGTLQREACFHGIPCVTLRGDTEWPELCEAGWNRLILPSDADAIAKAISRADAPSTNVLSPGAFGNGDTASRVCARLADELAG